VDPKKEEMPMKKAIVASLLVVGLSAPAFADTKWFVVVDTVKNCSVVEGGTSAGLTRIGNKDGYETKEAAIEALKGIRDDAAQCAGVVE
jgi:hypothetical protein